MSQLSISVLALTFLFFSCQDQTSTESSSQSFEESNNPSNSTSEQNPSIGSNQEEISGLQSDSTHGVAYVDQDYTFQNTSLQSVDFSPLSTPLQKFTIQAHRDTILKTRSGVELFVPAWCLEKQSGKVVQGAVSFEITEYFDYFDIVANQLTTSNGGQPLRSGGMFLLEAIAQGEALQLRENRELIMQVPGELEDAMRIYYGQRRSDGSMAWQKDEYSRQPYPSLVCNEGKYCDQARLYFEEQFRFDKASMIALLDDTLKYSISYNEKGVMIGNKICTDPAKPNKNKACKRFLTLAESLNDSIPGMIRSDWETTFSFVPMTYESYAAFREQKQQEREEFEKALQEKERALERSLVYRTAIRDDLASEQFYRKKPSLFIGGLGPINIDMKLSPPDLPHSDLYVQRTAENQRVDLLLKNGRSYLTPSRANEFEYIFRDLPRNAQVVLISSYQEGDDIYFASQELKTKLAKDEVVANLQFERLSGLAELRKRINGI